MLFSALLSAFLYILVHGSNSYCSLLSSIISLVYSRATMVLRHHWAVKFVEIQNARFVTAKIALLSHFSAFTPLDYPYQNIFGSVFMVRIRCSCWVWAYFRIVLTSVCPVISIRSFSGIFSRIATLINLCLKWCGEKSSIKTLYRFSTYDIVVLIILETIFLL